MNTPLPCSNHPKCVNPGIKREPLGWIYCDECWKRGAKRMLVAMDMAAGSGSAAEKLAIALLDFDEDNPGDADAPVQITAEVWAAWIDLAGIVERDEQEKAGPS